MTTAGSPRLERMAQAAQRQVGDMAIYRNSWGKGAPTMVRINGIEEKNGRLIYINSLGQWGYTNQYDDISNG